MRIRPGWPRHRRPREKAAAQDGSGAEPDELTAELTASYWRAHDQRLAQTSFGAIARQLPGLVGQAVRLGWEANRRDTVATIALKLVSGVLTGFALLATTGVLEALFAAGPAQAAGGVATAGVYVALGILLAVGALPLAVAGTAVLAIRSAQASLNTLLCWHRKRLRQASLTAARTTSAETIASLRRSFLACALSCA